MPDLARLQAMTARFVPVDISADISRLPSGEVKALAKMVQAGRIMDTLFLRQVWSGNEARYERLQKEESAICFAPVQSAAETELWIRPRDETGRTIRLTRAEVHLDIWGHGQNLALAQTERGVRLPLDREWPCTAWPDICGKQVLRGARLVLQADGFAPVTSRTFLPLGADIAAARPAGSSADTVSIEFDGIPPVPVREIEISRK